LSSTAVAAPPSTSDGPVRTGRTATAVKLGTVLLVVVILYALYMALGRKWIDLIDQAAIAALGATALNLLMGHTGLVSIGNAAFLGIGGLVTVELTIYLHWPLLAAILVAAAASAACSLFVALPALRIRGLYLVVGTLAFQFIVVYALQQVQQHQVGEPGYAPPVPTLLGTELATPGKWYWPLLVVLGIWLLLYRTLLTTKPGRAWRAIREQPTLAGMSGVPVVRYEIAAFMISSAVIGLSGGLLVTYLGNLSYDAFTLGLAVNYLAMVIIGGMGSIYGPVAGAAVITFLPTVIDSIGRSSGSSTSSSTIFLVQGAIVGLVFVVAIVVEPRGFAAVSDRVKARLRRRAVAPELSEANR
jgi:branched-chain amino acid transport system permease protein